MPSKYEKERLKAKKEAAKQKGGKKATAAKDDAEASTDDSKENIFLEQNWIPSLIDICRPDRTN